MKKCIHCGIVKELSDYYKHKQMADGHLNSCKECQKRRVSANRRRKKPYYKEYERQRFQRPERKAKVKAYQKRMREKNPGKYEARHAVNNALRDGRIEKPSKCEACGNRRKVEAHHHDYSKPLNVDWLCFSCHRKAHGQDPA